MGIGGWLGFASNHLHPPAPLKGGIGSATSCWKIQVIEAISCGGDVKDLLDLTWLRKQFLALLRRLQVSDQTFLIIVAVIVGGVVGGGAFLFEQMLEAASFLFWEVLPSRLGSSTMWVILTPALGALLLAPFILLFPDDATRDGVPATMEAVALKNGFMRWTNSFLRMIMSSITLGSGGSAGSEGPIIQIGSALASGVGQFLRVSGNRLRVIVACGAAAGLAAIFNAPIAGVLFALEVVLGEFNVHSFSPIVIASVVATAFSRAFMKTGSALTVLPYTLNSPWEILFYAVLGGMAGLFSVGFIRIMQGTERFFHGLRMPRALKPALGGLFVGMLGVFYPQIFGYSYLPITQAIYGQFSLTLLTALLVLKMVATGFTIGSGGSGGILCPSLFLGAMLGSACGELFNLWMPGIATAPGAYGVVGMGAMLGAVVQAPMTAIIMVFEMTNAYEVILPMMTSCILATLVQKSILQGSIYTLSLARKGIDIEAGREVGILSSLQVKDVMDWNAVTVPAAATYDTVLKRCLTHAGNYLYVVDEANHLEGVISFTDLKEFLFEEDFKGLVLARDLANSNVVYVTPEESLASALNKFSFIDMEQLPVVESQGESRRLLAVVTRSHLMRAYRQEMLKRAMVQDRHSAAGGPTEDRAAPSHPS